MQTAYAWAHGEFGQAELGDRRLTRRVVRLAAEAFENPSGLVTKVCQTSATREGAFRFLSNCRVDIDKIGEAHFNASARRCASHDLVIIPLDQSTLSITDRIGNKGFARTGTKPSPDRRGVDVMTAMALTTAGEALGICAQQWWLRPEEAPPSYAEDRRPVRDRISGLWTRTIEQVEQIFAQTQTPTHPWYQLDRGGDAWHVLQKAVEEGLLLTVRAAYDRRLDVDKGALLLSQALARHKPLARFEHYLRPEAARRAGHSAHRARHLELRTRQVTLRVVNTLSREKMPLAFWVVDVRERRPPQGCSRLHWTLLTTYPVESSDDAFAVVYGYTCRWRIEEFHRTWKSGCCDIEHSQLRSCEAFQRWATILAAVASRVEQLKSARADRKRNALELATRDEIDAAILLSQTKKFRMGRKLNAEQFVALVAQVGGYTGKSSGGPPGALTIARGLEKVTYTAKGIAAMRQK